MVCVLIAQIETLERFFCLAWNSWSFSPIYMHWVSSTHPVRDLRLNVAWKDKYCKTPNPLAYFQKVEREVSELVGLFLSCAPLVNNQKMTVTPQLILVHTLYCHFSYLALNLSAPLPHPSLKSHLPLLCQLLGHKSSACAVASEDNQFTFSLELENIM